MVPLNSNARTGFRADRRRSAFTVLELIVVIAVVLVLAMMFIPAVNGELLKARQVSTIHKAKSIHITLLAFASDHNGVFPTQINEDGDSGANLAPIKTANDAYADLIPRYISSEKVFCIPGSAWCNSTPPDEVISPGKKLERGENGFAYVPGLTSTSNANFPLVADGFKDRQPGVYTTDQKAKGGLWKGKYAIVIRVDGSAAIATVSPTDCKVYGKIAPDTRGDIFAPAPGWLEEKNRPLNPASK